VRLPAHDVRLPSDDIVRLPSDGIQPPVDTESDGNRLIHSHEAGLSAHVTTIPPRYSEGDKDMVYNGYNRSWIVWQFGEQRESSQGYVDEINLPSATCGIGVDSRSRSNTTRPAGFMCPPIFHRVRREMIVHTTHTWRRDIMGVECIAIPEGDMN